MTPIEVAERYNRLTVGAEPWLELVLDDLPQLESIKGEQKQTDMQHDRLTVGTTTGDHLSEGFIQRFLMPERSGASYGFMPYESRVTNNK
ncbi:MAG: hypothetical protein Q9203_004023 [Teloschistes exilis]